MEPLRQDRGATQRQPDSEKILAFLGTLSRHPGIETGDVAAVVSSVVAEGIGLFDADHLCIWQFDPKRETLVSVLRFDVAAETISPPLSLPYANVAGLLAAMRTAPLLDIGNLPADPGLDAFRDGFLAPTGITALLAHVIRAGGQDVGIFSLERHGAPRPWQAAEKILVQGIASYLALTYANSQHQETEARLRGMTDNLPGAVYQRLPDPAAPFLYVSHGVTRFTGDAPEPASGEHALSWASFIHPEDLPRVAAAYAKAAAIGSEYALEYRITHPVAGEMWVLDRGRHSSLANPANAVDGVLFNITPRKRAERAAQSLASLQNAILNNVGYAVISTDAKGTITFFNRAAEELLGYASEEVVGVQTPLVFHDIAQIRARLVEIKEHFGRDIHYPFEIFTLDALDGRRSEKEWTYIRKDGRQLTVNLMVAAIRSDAGEVEGFLGIVSDLSDRAELANRLRQSEDIAARVLLQSPDAILITSLKDGRILEVNPGFSTITGIARDTALGHSTIELGIWVDLAERDAMIDAIRRTGEVASHAIRVNRRGEGTRDCTMWARSFVYNGEPALLSVVHDVTEILRSARLAEDAEKMLLTVLNAIPSRVFWKDRDSVYLGCNHEFLIDSGLQSVEDVVGLRDESLPWGERAEAFRAADRRIMAGEPQIGLVERYPMPSGPPRWFEVSKLPLVGADGVVRGVLGIGNDVTEQRDALEHLRTSEEKLRALFETIPLGVTLSRVDGAFLEANDAFLKIIGYERQDLPTLSYQQISAPEYALSDREQADVLAAEGRYGPYEKEYIRRDGTRIAVSLNGSMITGTDGIRYVWSTVEDITLRRAAEDAQKRLQEDLERLVAERTAELKSAIEGLMRAERLASLGSLVAGVAHEISTPVGNASLATSTMSGSIVDFEKAMAEKLTRAGLESFVQQIKLGTDIANRNIERVAGLIQSFKQVAVDQTSSQRRNFRLTEIVEEIATTMHPSLKRSNVQLETEIPPGIVFDSFPGPLGQILTNLINNSLVHAFPGGRSGTIRITAGQKDAASVTLALSDDGVGIPAAVIGRIFDPFFTSKLGQGGSGLGLPIVHNLVTGILGGRIGVQSREGAGTTFTLSMPTDSPEPDPEDRNDGMRAEAP